MKKLFLLMLTVILVGLSAAAETATYTVKGQVLYAGDDEPLIGVTLLPVGGGMGTFTDANGDFTLKVPTNVKQLQVSYVGMVTRIVDIDTHNPMVIKLYSNENNLDEVIVVAYGTAKKSAYTGSASIVKAETIENSLVATATNALNGKVAGVQLLSDNGQPGVSPKIRIRGVGSMSAGNAPLYIVDGVPYDGDISSINTMDIESMTVLKDAAAAALYGARGANGVILITTKSGKQGHTKVSFDARWGGNSKQVAYYDVMRDPYEYARMAYNALYNGYYYNQNSSQAMANSLANANMFLGEGGMGYQMFTMPDDEGFVLPDGTVNPNARLGWSDGTNYFTPDDWRQSLRNGLRQEYSLSVTGGSERFNYYVSGAYLDDEGLIAGSHFNRLSTRTSMDYQIRPWLKIGTNMAYTYTNSGYPGDQTQTNSSANAFVYANKLAPVYPMFVRNADGSIEYNSFYNKPVYDYGNNKSVPYARNFMSSGNPAGDLQYNTTDYLTDIFNGKWFAVITPLEGLTVTGTAGVYTENQRYHDLGNPFYGQSAESGGSAYQQAYHRSAVNLQALANYRRTFGDKHDIDILVGYENYNLYMENVDAIGYNLYIPNSWVVDNTIDMKNGYGSYDKYTTRGIFGRINYNLMSRYFASVSVRRDASSRFAPGKRWGTFWSVSGAWDVAKESFMESYTWVNQLKLKASFGQQGNDDLLDAAGYSNYYPWQDQYRITGSNGVWSDGTLQEKGNPDITWETSNNFNAGIDFALFTGKLSGTLEYYNRQTSDMLYRKPVSPSNGYSLMPMNVGSMRNNGIELELNYQLLTTRNVNWDVNFNITSVNNKVLKLHPELNGQMINGSRIYREGESMYQLYLVGYAGVDPATGLALYYDAQPKLDSKNNPIMDDQKNYVIDYEFVSTDYTHANTYARKRSGNLMPKAYGGFGTSLTAYGFDLNLSFGYQFGGKIWDYSYQDLMHNADGYNMGCNWHMDIYNAWTPENPYTDVPRVDAQDKYTNSSSDRWLTSSNYLSLNNVTLGYTLPAKAVRAMCLENVRVNVSAENVALWSARKGLDPRQGYVNSDAATYGGIRCISGGVRVEF